MILKYKAHKIHTFTERKVFESLKYCIKYYIIKIMKRVVLNEKENRKYN